MPDLKIVCIGFVVICYAHLVIAEEVGVSSEAYDVARATLTENKKARDQAQADYDQKAITLEDDRAYLGKQERTRLNHHELYQQLGRDELYHRVKRRTRYKFLLAYTGLVLFVGGAVTAFVRTWQVQQIKDESEDPFNPDPPDHVPSHASYLIPTSLIAGVGLSLIVYETSFYTVDQTTATERIDMVRKHNEGLRHRLGLASSATSHSRSSARFGIRIAPMILADGGGVAVSLRY